MDKTQFKKILKPLMKECLKEILMEQGMLKVLSEAVQAEAPKQVQPVKQPLTEAKTVEKNEKVEEYKKKMLESIGKSGYVNSEFNPFANTEALNEGQAPTSEPKLGMKSNIDPAVLNNPGVDISGLMAMSKNAWKAHMGGKGK